MKVGAAGIETISGALKKPKKMDGHNHGNYLVATHRTAATTNPNCQRVYSFDADRYKRTSAPSENELYIRNRFAAVTRAVNTRMHNLQQIATDQAAFKAQKDTPGGKKTLKAYLWALEKAAYDASQG